MRFKKITTGAASLSEYSISDLRRRDYRHLARRAFRRATYRANGQGGLSLIELIIAIGISCVLLAAVGYTVAQLFSMNTRNSNHMTAVRNVQSAGYWISRDGQMARPQTASIASGGTFPLTLSWYDDPDAVLSTTHSVTYTLVGGVLYRQYDYGPQTRVADRLSASFPTITRDARNNITGFVFRVTSTVTSRGITETETRNYHVTLRPTDK